MIDVIFFFFFKKKEFCNFLYRKVKIFCFVVFFIYLFE
jgi:hypothetical protein